MTNAAFTCPTKVGVKVTVNGALWPAESVRGSLRLVLKFESLRVILVMVRGAEPVLVKAALWVFDCPTGTPPNQLFAGVTFRILVGAEKATLVAAIRKRPMIKLIEANLPRALGESELMSASFNCSCS